MPVFTYLSVPKWEFTDKITRLGYLRVCMLSKLFAKIRR
jgi:hypothetical protein